MALLLSAAALVGGAIAFGSPMLLAGAAVLAVALGATATRITHSELMVSRRDSYGSQARQAQAYAALSELRAEENSRFVEGMTASLARKDTALGQIEDALCAAQRRAADATRTARAESELAALAEAEGQSLARRVEDAEQRAAEAIVRVAELEQERDLLRAELDAWQVVGSQPFRKHA